MAMDDREQQFERALARLLRDASPESHCADAETLSAYHERSLPEAQMLHWKEHIAACVPCQEILALVEQSEGVQVEEWQKKGEIVEVEEEMVSALPAAAEVKRVPQQTALRAAKVEEPVRLPKAAGPRWKWLIPVGALAACAIAAVGIREIQMQNRRQAATLGQMAQNQSPEQQAAVPFSAPPAPQSMQQLNQRQHQAQALDKEAMRDQKQASPAAPSTPPPSNAIASSNYAVTPSIKNEPVPVPRREALTNPAARMAVPAAPETSDAVTAEKDRSTEALIPARPAPSLVAGAAKKSAPEAKEQGGAPSTAQTAEVQADSMRAGLRKSGVPVNSYEASLVEVAAADHRYIVAPGMKSVWRVGDAGQIERSTDRGKTWKQESSGVTADLIAGSATSDKVCWVIGKNGTILLSTDGGKNWKQVASPIGGDIGGIHASDAQHASIWDVPNRVSFETSDGGTTWKRVANE